MNRAISLFSVIVAYSLLFISSPAFAQYDEFGVQFGFSRYKGELSPHLIDNKFLHPAFGIFYRHDWTRNWGERFDLNYGKISGDDKQAQNEFERIRNLNFYSTIWDFTYALEFNFLPFETGNNDYPFTPYLFTGLTVFHFNPRSDWNGQSFDLQPLGTEGQGIDGRPGFYHRVAIAMPIGGGIKVTFGGFGMALQISARRTFTDYLDDVSTTYPDQNHLMAARGPVAAHFSDPSIFGDTISAFYPTLTTKQRGISSDQDWYVFGTINVFIRLNSFIKEFCRPFKRRRYS